MPPKKSRKTLPKITDPLTDDMDELATDIDTICVKSRQPTPRPMFFKDFATVPPTRGSGGSQTSLPSEYTNTTDNVSALQSMLKSKCANLADLSSQKEASIKQVKQLTERKNIYKTAHLNGLERLKAAKLEKDVFRAELEAEQIVRRKLESDLTEVEEKLRRSEDEVKKLNDEVKAEQQQREEEVKRLNEEIKTGERQREDEVKRLSEEIRSYCQQRKELERSLEKAQQDVKNIQSQAETEHTQLTDNLTTASTRNTQLTSDLAVAQDENAKSRTILKQQQEQSAKDRQGFEKKEIMAAKTMASLQNKYDVLLCANEQVNEEYRTLKAENDSLKVQIQAVARAAEEHVKTFRSLKVESDQLAKSNEWQKEQMEKDKKFKELLIEGKEFLMKEMGRLKKVNRDLEDVLAARNKALAEKDADLKHWTAGRDDLVKDLEARIEWLRKSEAEERGSRQREALEVQMLRRRLDAVRGEAPRYDTNHDPLLVKVFQDDHENRLEIRHDGNILLRPFRVPEDRMAREDCELDGPLVQSTTLMEEVMLSGKLWALSAIGYSKRESKKLGEQRPKDYDLFDLPAEGGLEASQEQVVDDPSQDTGDSLTSPAILGETLSTSALIPDPSVPSATQPESARPSIPKSPAIKREALSDNTPDRLLRKDSVIATPRSPLLDKKRPASDDLTGDSKRRSASRQDPARFAPKQPRRFNAKAEERRNRHYSPGQDEGCTRRRRQREADRYVPTPADGGGIRRRRSKTRQC